MPEISFRNVIVDFGLLRTSLNNNLLVSMKKGTGVLKAIEPGVKRSLTPQMDLARAHYTNAMEEAARFMGDSEMDNDFSGVASYDVITPESEIETAYSMYTWNPLTKKYKQRKHKRGVDTMWRYTGSLYNAAKTKVAKADVGLQINKYKPNAVLTSLGTFEYTMTFKSLGDAILDEALRVSFVEASAVDPAELGYVEGAGGSGLGKLPFLEIYRPENAGNRGGIGRPMISSIGATLGKKFHEKFNALSIPTA